MMDMIKNVKMYNDNEGTSYVVAFPAKFEVCDRCGGHGHHMDPRFDNDGQGYTSSEWQEECDADPEFSDNYFGGRFDCVCEVCKGKNVVLVIDEARLDEDQELEYQKYLAFLQEMEDQEYERASERRMGA
jgi:hypothetical protein